MPNDVLSDAPYIDRFKSRFGNSTDNGTKPVAPEGHGDSWFDKSTRELSLPDPAGTSWVDYKITFSKVDATVSPGVSNDNTEDYHVGSIWVDVTADTAYICVDASTGAAVWDEVGAGGGGGGAELYVLLTKDTVQLPLLSTLTKVTWDNEVIDIDLGVDLGSDDTRININTTGTYQFEIKMYITNNGISTDVLMHNIRLYKNDSLIDTMLERVEDQPSAAAGSGIFAFCKSTPMSFTDTDYIDIQHIASQIVGSGDKPEIGTTFANYDSHLMMWKVD